MQLKLDKGMPTSLNEQVAHPEHVRPSPNCVDLTDRMGAVTPRMSKKRKTAEQPQTANPRLNLGSKEPQTTRED